MQEIEKIIILTIHGAKGNKLAVMDVSTRKIYEIEEISDDLISWSDR